MTITHSDGSPVARSPALALIKPSPGNGFRTRKALLGPYFYFPLGFDMGNAFQAYDLSPGQYRLSIHRKEKGSGSPVVIGTVPLEVYDYK